MSPKKRILFLCDEIDGATGGSEQNIGMLLNSLPMEGYKIYLALLRKEKDLPEGILKADPYILGLRSYRKVSQVAQAILKLRRIIRENKIDILQVYFRDSQLMAALSFPQSLGCKLVIARRSLGYDISPISLLRNRFIGYFPSYFLVNSFCIKKELVDKEKIPDERITVIYNPINAVRAKNGISKRLDRLTLGISDDNLIIGIVANIRPVKDYATFFRAAQIINQKVPKTRFIIVGSEDPGYWGAIKHMVYNSSLKENCIFLKDIENPYTVIPIFDVGVLTSSSEGLSNSLIEYAVAGIPAVATKAGGNSEIVMDRVTGYLAPIASPGIIADKILELIFNKNKRLEMGTNARKNAFNKFDPENIMREYDLFYNRILQ